MKLRAALVFSLLLFLGCSGSSGNKVDNLVKQGFEHLDRFDFDQAKEAFDAAGLEAKVIPYDRWGTGLILERKRFFFNALDQYLKLSLEYPDFAPGFSGVYRIYSYYGFYEKALAASGTAYQLAPKDPEVLIDRFQSLLQSGLANQALEVANASSGVLDKLSSNLLKVQALSASNEFDSAKILLETTSATPPATAMQFRLMAGALESLSLIDSAMNESRKAARISDAPTAVIIEHFNRAVRTNYYYDTRQAVKMLESRGADKTVTMAMEIIIAKEQKRYPWALILNSDLNTIVEKNVSTLFFDLSAGGPQYSDANLANTLSAAIESNLRNLDFTQELQDFVNTLLAMYISSTTEKVTAWDKFKNLSGEFARTPKIQLAKVSLQYKSGQFDDAMAELEKLRNANVNRNERLTAIADIYADPEIKKHDLAQETYEQVLSKNEWNKEAFEHKVQHLRRINKTKEALKQFATYPQFEKNFHDLAVLRALCLFKEKEYDAAFEIIKQDGKFIKGNMAPFFEIVAILERVHQDKLLSQLVEICAGWAGENADILNFCTRFLNDEKKFDRALELVEKSISLEPESVEAFVQKARGMYGTGNRVEALEQFDKILKENPNDGDANYYYSGILASEKIDAQRTTNMARAALRSFYSDEKAHINLSQAYMAFGQDKFALGAARTGSKEFPQSDILWYLCGVAASKLGRADAEDHLKKAIELGLEGEKLTKAKEILAKL